MHVLPADMRAASNRDVRLLHLSALRTSGNCKAVGGKVKDSTAKTLMSILAMFVFFWALTFARVPYTCKPIAPPDECGTGAYEIWFFEHDNARRPHGVVDAHCVYKSDGRLVAETLRLTSYDQTGEIRDVEWFERQEFPDSHAEVCQVK